jgi:hypothetical protein
VVELEVSWPDAATAAAGVHGPPYAATLSALSADQRERYDAAALARFADPAGPIEAGGPVRRQSAAVIATATAP